MKSVDNLFLKHYKMSPKIFKSLLHFNYQGLYLPLKRTTIKVHFRYYINIEVLFLPKPSLFTDFRIC